MCKACRLYDKQSQLIDDALKTQIPYNFNINIEELKANIKNKLSEK
ncbi:MAG: hypothetical protein L3J74_14295 [Bacteroidales bacterium]|nr:hypothetical protein [Bacteroidales bacterium]